MTDVFAVVIQRQTNEFFSAEKGTFFVKDVLKEFMGDGNVPNAKKCFLMRTRLVGLVHQQIRHGI